MLGVLIGLAMQSAQTAQQSPPLPPITSQQADPVGEVTVPTYAMIRADAAMRRAWQGRKQAIERVCGDRARINRLRALDADFGRAQQAYQRRFGILWQSMEIMRENEPPENYAEGVAGSLSGQTNINPRCQSLGGFAGALGEFQNGVALALVELGK